MMSHVVCGALGASQASLRRLACVYRLKRGWWSASLLFSLLLSHRLETSCFTIDIYLTVWDWRHEINPKHSSLLTEEING